MQVTEFKLRPWRQSDLPDLVRHANNQKIAKNMTDKFPHPYSEANGQAFIEFATKDDPIHIFAITVHDEAVGGIGIHPQDDVHKLNAELGYWLSETLWGRGIISTAIGQAVDFAFTTYPLQRVFARPFGSNLASQRVLEKNGFVLEARFDKILLKGTELTDELVYAVRRSDWIQRRAK